MKFLFDWNGTIADDMERAWLATNHALTRSGAAAIALEDFDRSFMLPMDTMFARLGVRPDFVGGAILEWNKAMASRPAPIRDGAMEFLDRARGAETYCAVISAASADYVLAELRHFGLDGSFDAVVTDAADKVEALKGLRADGMAAYFGDTEYDMQCAVEAGCIPVGVLSGYCSEARLRAAGAVLVIRDYGELPAVNPAGALASAGSPRK